jgi:hypothetical protein
VPPAHAYQEPLRGAREAEAGAGGRAEHDGLELPAAAREDLAEHAPGAREVGRGRVCVDGEVRGEERWHGAHAAIVERFRARRVRDGHRVAGAKQG